MSYSTRPARASDYASFTRLIPELAVHDPVPTFEAWESRMAPLTLFVEAPAAGVVGYVFAQVLDGAGYVYHVVVDPEWRGRGVGHAMMAAIAERFRAAGCATWCLNVKIGNAPARRLYERWGLRVSHASKALRIAWSDVARLAESETETLAARVVTVDAARERAVEARFDLPPGRIAGLRVNPERVFLGLEEAGDVVGFAAFDPAFPGAMPFRVARPSLAPALLRAVRLHARPADARVSLVAEGDPGLVALLEAAGAEVTMDLLHLTGTVPTSGEPRASTLKR